MNSLRLKCHVFAPGDEELPNSDVHPFWIAIDDFGDAIAESLKARGVDLDAQTVIDVDENGSLLTMSSDAPAWAAYFWVYLPVDTTVQAELLPVLLDHLSRAKEAIPDAQWQVTLGDEPLIWDSDGFVCERDLGRPVQPTGFAQFGGVTAADRHFVVVREHEGDAAVVAAD